jgi:DNA-binding CsgD family transcriptional regulator
MQILTLICTRPQLVYKQIAAKLRISPNTVAGHICAMQAALQVQSRCLLMIWGWQHPEALRGEWADPKIHKPGCLCGGPLCKASQQMPREDAA